MDDRNLSVDWHDGKDPSCLETRSTLLIAQCSAVHQQWPRVNDLNDVLLVSSFTEAYVFVAKEQDVPLITAHGYRKCITSLLNETYMTYADSRSYSCFSVGDQIKTWSVNDKHKITCISSLQLSALADLWTESQTVRIASAICLNKLWYWSNLPLICTWQSSSRAKRWNTGCEFRKPWWAFASLMKLHFQVRRCSCGHRSYLVFHDGETGSPKRCS